MLKRPIEDLLVTIGREFPSPTDASPDELLVAYTHDQLHARGARRPRARSGRAETGRPHPMATPGGSAPSTNLCARAHFACRDHDQALH
jgi:hypothetical protein